MCNKSPSLSNFYSPPLFFFKLRGESTWAWACRLQRGPQGCCPLPLPGANGDVLLLPPTVRADLSLVTLMSSLKAWNKSPSLSNFRSPPLSFELSDESTWAWACRLQRDPQGWRALRRQALTAMSCCCLPQLEPTCHWSLSSWVTFPLVTWMNQDSVFELKLNQTLEA